MPARYKTVQGRKYQSMSFPSGSCLTSHHLKSSNTSAPLIPTLTSDLNERHDRDDVKQKNQKKRNSIRPAQKKKLASSQKIIFMPLCTAEVLLCSSRGGKKSTHPLLQ